MKVSVFFTLLIWCMLSGACLYNETATGQAGRAQVTPSEPDGPTRLSIDEYAVLLAVVGDKPFVMKNATVGNYSGQVSAESILFVGLAAETIADYNRKNFNGKETISTAIERKFPTDAAYVLLTKENLEQLWNFTNSNATDRWKTFKETYGTNGYFSASRVGFNSERNQALAFVSFTCGTLCADGTYYFLVRVDGKWRVESKETVWVS